MFEREQTTASGAATHGLSVRSVVLGLVAVAAISFVTPYSDLLIRGTWMACSHLPMAPLLIFAFLILGANTLLKPLSPRLCLTHAELFIVYIMMLIGAMLPSFGITAYLIPTLAGSNYFATPESKWAEMFFSHVKPWLVPWDPAGGGQQEVVRRFYEGIHPEESIPWAIWIKPLASWTAFAFTLFFVWVCLATVIRKQWVDREKLAFPLVQLPVEMARSEGIPSANNPFFRNKLMWLGVMIPFSIHSLNALHLYFPAIPEIMITQPLNSYFTSPPWNQMGPFIVWTHFSVIGFSYLLSSELSFSLWSFFLMFKMQEVMMAAWGMEAQYIPNYPVQSFAAYQMLGGFLVFFGYMVYLTRGQMTEVYRRAMGRTKEPIDANELVSYRTAFFGLILGTIFLAGWMAAAGLNFWIGILSLLIFYMIAVTLSRFVAEGGLLFIQAPFRPTDLIGMTAGTAAIGPASLTALTFVERIFIFDLRGFMMPSLLDSLKLSDAARLARRKLTWAIAASIVVAVFVSYATVIWIAYRKGGGVNLSQWFLAGSPTSQFNLLTQTIQDPKPRDWSGATFTTIGAMFTLFLSYMRVRFAGWPFHPVGYAMGPSWPMIQLWFSIMVGWAMKALILRYGGTRAFLIARPLFLGLVLGEFAAGGFWLTIDALAGIKDHRIFLS